MLKNQISGNSILLYMVNFLTCTNFEVIYKIKEINYTPVTIEAFKTTRQMKRFYRCVHASEVCKFTPKCIKCTDKYFRKNCPKKAELSISSQIGGRKAPYRGGTKNHSYI